MKKILFFCALLLVFSGCANPYTKFYKDLSGGVTSLGSLRMRSRIIRLERGGKFSILDLSGDPISMSLSRSEFQEKFPRLYKNFETAIAADVTEDITIDASW